MLVTLYEMAVGCYHEKMKLITLNMEGVRHLPKVQTFLTQERADVVCLQEAPEEMIGFLESLGYTAKHLPRALKNQDGIDYVDGIILASLHTATFKEHYYYKPTQKLEAQVFDLDEERYNNWQCVLVGTVTFQEQTYTIATTHHTWTPEGDKPGKAQIGDLQKMLSYTRTIPPHVICGDFNIPRFHNYLYTTLIQNYTDTIPEEYKSSLDASLHRSGTNPEKTKLFTYFMVDYIFTQPPYSAQNVRLQFGISDHAAVVADISKIK
jgi:endonuclease/exonuclease/phosphatase family metal-dependent hydrolase